VRSGGDEGGRREGREKRKEGEGKRREGHEGGGAMGRVEGVREAGRRGSEGCGRGGEEGEGRMR